MQKIANVIKKNNVENLCRCNQPRETMPHITGGCRVLTLTPNTVCKRHHQMAGIIHNILQNLNAEMCPCYKYEYKHQNIRK